MRPPRSERASEDVHFALSEDELPTGYHLKSGRRGILAVDADLESAILAAGFGPDGGESLEASELSGRRPLRVLRVGGERFVVRVFHHGGMSRGLGPRFYLDPHRPFRELFLARRLTELGIRTPHVAAARARRQAPFGWRLDLVTRLIEGTIDGAAAVTRLTRGEPDGRVRRLVARRLGEVCGRLHAAGFVHADLHPRNFLFEAHLADGAAPWVLDLDGSRFVRGLTDAARRRNLARLWRWLRRREQRGRFLLRTDAARFLRAYEEARGGQEGEWKGDWASIDRRERRGRALHRTGWVIESLLGSGHEQRDGRLTPRA